MRPGTYEDSEGEDDAPGRVDQGTQDHAHAGCRATGNDHRARTDPCEESPRQRCRNREYHPVERHGAGDHRQGHAQIQRNRGDEDAE